MEFVFLEQASYANILWAIDGDSVYVYNVVGQPLRRLLHCRSKEDLIQSIHRSSTPVNYEGNYMLFVDIFNVFELMSLLKTRGNEQLLRSVAERLV